MPWDEVMDKWKEGTLRSGSTGKPIHDHDQAVAIMLSERHKALQGKKEYQPKKKKSMGDRMREVARGEK
jgi:hypothetical protein